MRIRFIAALMSVCLSFVLVYRLWIAPPVEVIEASAPSTWATRFSRLISWTTGSLQSDRHARIAIHVFEARSTGVLPLAFPPMQAGAVTNVGERMAHLIRETARYYSSLNALYPAAQFELVSAEEKYVRLNPVEPELVPSTGFEQGTFVAGDYTVHVNPALLDRSDWLTTEITVYHRGRFLLGNRVTRAQDDTPIVISGPLDEDIPGSDARAVFVGVQINFVTGDMVDRQRAFTRMMREPVFDTPPRLVTLGDVAYPDRTENDEQEGMPIYFTRIGKNGAPLETRLVASLAPDYDRAALEAIKRSEFVSATHAGQPVESWMFIPVQFFFKKRMPVSVSSSKNADP